MKAQFLGLHRFNKVFSFPVVVTKNHGIGGTLEEWCSPERERFDVVAYTAQDAANYVRDLFATVPETEVTAYGPRGGKTSRYIGYFSAIGSALAARPDAEQLVLF